MKKLVIFHDKRVYDPDVVDPPHLDHISGGLVEDCADVFACLVVFVERDAVAPVAELRY